MKSSLHILILFNFKMRGKVTYSAGALAFLYDQLNTASLHGCKQLAGYLTLLQSWIFEHFPEMGCQSLNMGYSEDDPRADRWTPGKGPGVVGGYRKALDELTMDDVCWTPYTVHRETRPFQQISTFSGYIRWGSLSVPHLPERVMRQYGFIQGIPRPPRVITGGHTQPEEMHSRWVQFDQHLLQRFVTPDMATRPGDCVDGYLEWYFSISHPFVIHAIADIRRPLIFPQPVPQPQPDTQPGPRSSASSSSHSVDETVKQVSAILKSCQEDGFATEGTELWRRIDQCTMLLAGLTTAGVPTTGGETQSEMRSRVEKTYQRKRTRPHPDQ